MLPVECHAVEHSHATGILAECEHELEGEKSSRKVSIRAETRPKIPQKDKSVMSIECETDKTASEDEATRSTSIQQTIDMLEHNIHEHVKQTRSYPLRTIAVKDSTREERRANCTHQCKECSDKSTQNFTEHPENSGIQRITSGMWLGVRRGRNSPDLTTIRKQSKANCWQEKPIPTYNSFEGLEKVSEDANNSTESVREAKPPPIFISKLNDTSSLRQLLNQIANDEFELKNIKYHHQ